MKTIFRKQFVCRDEQFAQKWGIFPSLGNGTHGKFSCKVNLVEGKNRKGKRKKRKNNTSSEDDLTSFGGVLSSNEDRDTNKSRYLDGISL